VAKERSQNPTPGDIVNLRLVTFNSNNPANVSSIVQVSIYYLDPTQCTESNPDGRTLIETIPGSSVTSTDTGQYLAELTTTIPAYVIGRYLDIWDVVFATNSQISSITNTFQLYSDLWYTSTMPAVYGFDFQFQPNRIRKGSIKWLIIKIIPNVPHATDLERYYTNLAISSNMTITIEKNCGICPQPCDSNFIVEDDLVDVRSKCFGYYQIDTTDDGPGFECGLYDVWFTLSYAGSVDVSPRMQMQIF
jgi:hypothetical protein